MGTGSGVHPVPDADHPQKVSLALHLFAAGRYRESVAMWKSIARDTPDRERRWRALQQIGIGYDALEDYERAVHFYELALAEGAPLAEIGEELGRARRKLG
jgi:tetratricopeptide (TPR) repeat protein